MTRPLTVKAIASKVGEYSGVLKSIGWVLACAAALVYTLGAAGNRSRLDRHDAEISELRAAVKSQTEASADTTRALNQLTVRVGELVGEMRGMHREATR